MTGRALYEKHCELRFAAAEWAFLPTDERRAWDELAEWAWETIS